MLLWGLDPAVFGLVLLGALLAIEQVSVAQLQLSHAFVAGTLAGLLTGHAGEGALLGALLGLLTATYRPVGGVIPPDGGPAAVVAVGALAGGGTLAGAAHTGAALGAALLVGLLIAELGRVSEAWTRELNLGLVRRAEAEATTEAVRRAVLWAIVIAAARGALTVVIGLALATPLVAWLDGRGLAPVVVVALAGGLGLVAHGRFFSFHRVRGIILAAIGLVLTIAIGGGS
jgi:PTS system mannose-specific IIC component